MKLSRRNLARRSLIKQLTALLGGISLLPSAIAQKVLLTPKQTEGPFYPPLPLAETDVDLTMLEGHSEPAKGDVILVRGRVTTSDGQPLKGAKVDIWQANSVGRYTHPDDPNPAPLDPNFQGIGITYTDDNGWYGFKTIIPAPYPLSFLDEGNNRWRAKHIHFKVAHPSANELTTQMYFAGDPLLNEDLAFLSAPEPERDTLVTVGELDVATGLSLHRFDITLA